MSRSRLAFLFALAALMVAIGTLAYFSHIHQMLPGDHEVADELQVAQGSGWVGVLKFVSWFGQDRVIGPLVFGAFLILFMANIGLERWVLLGAFMLEELSTFGIKELVGRPRPSADVINVFDSGSRSGFPSEHVVSYVVLLGLLLLWTTLRVRPCRSKVLLQVALGFLIVVIGPARIALGSQWPTDVLGGYMVGALLLLAIVGGLRFLRVGPLQGRPVPSQGAA